MQSVREVRVTVCGFVVSLKNLAFILSVIGN